MLYEFHRQKLSPVHEFSFHREMNKLLNDANIHLRGVALRLYATDTAAQGAEQSAVLMTQCPNCKEYYVSPMAADPEAFMRGGEMPRDVCPHCGTDRMEWYKENLKKKK